jgi:hypothetical protein
MGLAKRDTPRTCKDTEFVMGRYFIVEGTLTMGWKRMPMSDTFFVLDLEDDPDAAMIVIRRSERYFGRFISGVVWKQVRAREVPADLVQHAVELPAILDQ